MKKTNNTKRTISPIHFITGSFIQLDNITLNWDSAQWSKEFSLMKEIEMDTLVIQFSGNQDRVYYPSKSFSWDSAMQGYQVLFQQAEKQGINIYIGLLNIQGWWSAANRPDYFPKALKIQKMALDELNDLYGKSKAFAGWYIPEEIDDLNWQTPEKQKLLIDYFSNLIDYCHKLSGNKPIMTAPFTGWNPGTKMYMTPRAFELWWTEFLKQTRFDIVAIQDASARAQYHQQILPPYFKALQSACNKSGSQLWSDLEVFQQIQGWPIDQQSFKAEPANFDRIIQQIQIESPYVGKIICFEFNHYMSPSRGEKQKMLYQAYKEWFLKAKTNKNK